MPVKGKSKPVSLRGMMDVLVQVPITKYHKLDSLEATEIYIPSSGSWKCKNQVQAQPGSVESCLLSCRLLISFVSILI